MDPTYPLAPIANLLGSVLVLLPVFTKFRRSWNTGVCMLAIWVSIENFANGINTIVWSDNTDDVAPVWCDITSRIFLGAYIAKPACSLVITRRLYRAVALHNTGPAAQRKIRHELIVDLIICLAFPILIMALYYIVQSSRYDIFEVQGCADAYDAFGLSLVLINVWSIIPCTISALFYCPRILAFFYRRRRTLNDVFTDSSISSRTHYYNLLFLGCLDILLTLPFNTVNFASCVEVYTIQEIGFWPGWTYIHSDWAPLLIPMSDVRAIGPWELFNFYYSMWFNIPLSIAFFLIFGLTNDARKSYCHAFWLVVGLIGIKPPKARATRRDLSTIAFDAPNPPAGRETTATSYGTASGDLEHGRASHGALSDADVGTRTVHHDLDLEGRAGAEEETGVEDVERSPGARNSPSTGISVAAQEDHAADANA